MGRNKDKNLSEEKSLLIFQRVLDEDNTQKEILKIRNNLKIPFNGFRLKKISDIKFTKKEDFSFHLENSGWVSDSEYQKETKRLASFFPIMNHYFSILLRNYIYYNKLLLKELDKHIDHSDNACKILDANWENRIFGLDSDSTICEENHKPWKENIKDTIYNHPISIRFKSDVSQRMLVDFIKKNWKEISTLEKEYFSKETKYILRDSKRKINLLIKKRDDFIYKNKDIPRRELWEILNKKYKNALGLQYESLNKIISRETKRRHRK